MKKFIIFILIILLIPVYAIAAGTITCTDHIYYGVSKLSEIRFITYTVTFGVDATSPADTVMKSVSGMKQESLFGWWILEVDIIPGDAQNGPTDDTDMYLYRPAASSVLPGWGTKKIDVLGGNGVDKLDNATISTFNPATTTRPLTGEEILSFANNAVNDAVTTITFTLYR